MLTFGELSVFATTFVSSAILFFFLWMKRNGKSDAGIRRPPTASTLSLFGAMLRGGMTVLPNYFMKTAEKLGPVTSYKIGGNTLIILNGKEAIVEAFVRKSEAFADRVELWTEVNVFNPNLQGIIFGRYNNTFKKYHKQCLSILKEFGFGVNSVSETRIHCEIESMIDKLLKHGCRPLDPKPFSVLSTFNVVSSILFGREHVSSDSCLKLAENISGFAQNYDFATNFAPFMRFVPYYRRKISRCEVHNKAIINGIEEGIKFSRASDCESTFVRRFIEIEGSNYDHQDLVYILRDLCLGSAETVSTTLQWAVVELANHPQVQKRFQQEIDDMVAADRLPSLDDKPRLPYTEAVILEVFRRRTAIPFFVPHQTFKDTEVFGMHIPKGCTVIANGASAHMDPKVWKDPENFRPERFLDEQQKITGSGNVIPFSLGKRSCLGEILGRQETFLFLTSLVQRFDIRPPEGQDRINVTEIIGGALHPSEFKVRLIPRTTNKR